MEAKEVGKKLSNYDEQLGGYFAKSPEAKLGILTNGVQWRFFTDIVHPNVMDKEPWIIFVADASHRSVLEGPTHLRPELDVRHEVGHGRFDEKVEQGVIGRGDATPQIGFRRTRGCPHQTIGKVEKLLGIDRHFPVTSPNLVFLGRPHADVGPSVDLLVVES